MSPASSTGYSACLVPDRRLRAAVSGSAIALYAGGLLAVSVLPVAGAGRLAIGVAVVAAAAAEAVRLRGCHRVRAITLRPDRSATLLREDGARLHGRLAAGSVVRGRLAWLRIAIAGVPCHVELLAGKCSENNDWRRLQVIWRHVGDTP